MEMSGQQLMMVNTIDDNETIQFSGRVFVFWWWISTVDGKFVGKYPVCAIHNCSQQPNVYITCKKIVNVVSITITGLSYIDISYWQEKFGLCRCDYYNVLGLSSIQCFRASPAG